jgi:hypothetical protein
VGDGVINICLSNCPSLLKVRLAGNLQSQGQTDTWIQQIAVSVTRDVSGLGSEFYYNDSVPGGWAEISGLYNTPSFNADYVTLTNRGWSFIPWHGF